MASMPREVEEAVARAIFGDMEDLGWAGLSHGQRSSQYARWIRDPRVGGRLIEFMAEERARVWIKDGPVKERPRALAGVGRYAGMVDGGTEVGSIVRLALGKDWAPIEGSVLSKPLRVRARSELADQEVTLTWGPSNDLKHLVWAALRGEAECDPFPWHIAVVGTFTQPTSADQRAANQRIARRANVPITHIELRR